jgi:ribosomal protein S18 acetylase RimI-like enzyme
LTAYRFCRTDDVPLLVRAHNACYAEPTGTPPIAVEDFKRWMRELDVWCSSCMVAFEGSEPVGVLIAAKRAHASFLHRIGVRPEHRRQGHARHMLESLARKMAILEPRTLLAEVPSESEAALRLFDSCGYAAGDTLTDWAASPLPGEAARPGDRGARLHPSPVTWTDLEDSGTLAPLPDRWTWLRSLESLRIQSGDLRGLAFVSDLRIEAWLLYRDPPALSERHVAAFGAAASTESGDGALRGLLIAARSDSPPVVRLVRVHPREIASTTLVEAGFASGSRFVTYAADAAPG